MRRIEFFLIKSLSQVEDYNEEDFDRKLFFKTRKWSSQSMIANKIKLELEHV